MDFDSVKEEKRPPLTFDNYRDNAMYPWKADWEMPDKEYDDSLAKLKKQHKDMTMDQLKQEYKQNFSSFAMKKSAFKGKYWVRVYKNPEYKYDFEDEKEGGTET